MLVQLAAQFFVLVALKLFRLINVFNILIMIVKFSIKKNKDIIYKDIILIQTKVLLQGTGKVMALYYTLIL